MSSSRKKVIVRLADHKLAWGYLPLSGILERGVDGPEVALLDLGGRVTGVPLETVRYIAYVRDFNLDDAVAPERLARRTFLARPRTEGLWLRLTFTGGEVLEGTAACDLSLADGLLEDQGVYLVPPDIRSNTQRLFVPRLAMTALQVLGVIASAVRTKPEKRPALVERPLDQSRLFPEPDEGGGLA